MMGVMLPTTTSPDIADLHPDTAILPTGSFEQHGRHLPLTTDSLIATAIAERLAADYNLFVLPVLTFGCSHEHAGFPGTVSISAHTLGAVVSDIFDSLAQSGVDRLVLVNAHGGNYVLSNVVQEGSASGRRMPCSPRVRNGKKPATKPGCRPPTTTTCTPEKPRRRSCCTVSPMSFTMTTRRRITLPTTAAIS